jgi:hypothetical protein
MRAYKLLYPRFNDFQKAAEISVTKWGKNLLDFHIDGASGLG